MSEHAPTLPDLLARWHALAPEECDRGADCAYQILTRKDEWGDADSHFWLHGEGLDTWALVLGAVVYHAARRGLSTKVHVDPLRLETRVQARCRRPEAGGGIEQQHVMNGDGAAALRAAAVALLSAYLDAVQA